MTAKVIPASSKSLDLLFSSLHDTPEAVSPHLLFVQDRRVDMLICVIDARRWYQDGPRDCSDVECVVSGHDEGARMARSQHARRAAFARFASKSTHNTSERCLILLAVAGYARRWKHGRFERRSSRFQGKEDSPVPSDAAKRHSYNIDHLPVVDAGRHPQEDRRSFVVNSHSMVCISFIISHFLLARFKRARAIPC